MDKNRKEFGKQYLVEFTGCNVEKLKFVSALKGPFLQAAKESGATILESYFHQFEPYGVTGMIFIAESHFSIHTWPESGYAAFDVLTCGVMRPEKTIDALKIYLEAKKVDVRILTRGFVE